LYSIFFFFFFSSRRRHTRSLCDWSSDVCSSDLDARSHDRHHALRLCQLWALRNPERVMTIVRPCIVLGPNVNNYIVRLWTDQPRSEERRVGKACRSWGEAVEITKIKKEDL